MLDDRVLAGVLNRGATTLVTVPVSGEAVALAELPVVVGGSRVVRSFDARNGSVAVVVSSGDLADIQEHNIRAVYPRMNALLAQQVG